MKSVVATYAGRCRLCDEPIVEDVDRIVRVGDQWAHAQCVEDMAVLLDDE